MWHNEEFYFILFIFKKKFHILGKQGKNPGGSGSWTCTAFSCEEWGDLFDAITQINNDVFSRILRSPQSTICLRAGFAEWAGQRDRHRRVPLHAGAEPGQDHARVPGAHDRLPAPPLERISEGHAGATVQSTRGQRVHLMQHKRGWGDGASWNDLSLYEICLGSMVLNMNRPRNVMSLHSYNHCHYAI